MSPMVQDIAIVAGILIVIALGFWAFAPRREAKRKTLPERIVYALHVIARWFVCLADGADSFLQAFRQRKAQSGIVLDCEGWEVPREEVA